MKARALAVPAACIAILASACASRGNEAAQTTPVSTSSSPASESPSPSGSASASSSPTVQASPLIENGRNFAFIKSVDAEADPATITYDLAYFLTGDAAAKAAKEHGDESPPPNDYYIVNDNPRLRTVPLSPGAPLVLLDWNNCCDKTFRGSLTDFARSFDEGQITVGGHRYNGNLSPYWLIARNGQIVRIEEQYLP